MLFHRVLSQFLLLNKVANDLPGKSVASHKNYRLLLEQITEVCRDIFKAVSALKSGQKVRLIG